MSVHVCQFMQVLCTCWVLLIHRWPFYGHAEPREDAPGSKFFNSVYAVILSKEGEWGLG